MTRRRTTVLTVLALAALPLLFLAVFFAYPVVRIVLLGLHQDGAWQWHAAWSTLADPGVRHVLWFTTWQALASTGLTLAVGLPGAYVLSRLRFPGRSLVRALVTVPFVLPTVVVGTAFLALLGSGGLLDDWFGVTLDSTPAAIVIAHVFFNYAVVVRTVGGLWSRLDPRQEEAAMVLGASRWRAWRTVTLPALAPAVAAAALMVFLFTFTSFGTVQILGGPRYATLEVEIYRQTADLLDLPAAAVLTLLQFAVVLVVLLVHGTAVRRRTSALGMVAAGQAERPPRSTGERLFLAGNLLFMAVLVVVPLAMLVLDSVRSSRGWTLAFFRALFAGGGDSTLFVPPWQAITNSLRFAVLATVVALVVGGLASVALARRGTGRVGRGLDLLLMLPLGTSAVTVGFGFLISLDRPPLDLRSSFWLVPLAQALVGIPFVVRTMLPVLRAVSDRLREAAAVLGASPWRVWREVDLPMVRRAVLVAAGFAFAVSLGEFGATVFLARPDQPTLPVAIARFLGRAGEINTGQAMAMSVILMAVSAASMLTLERLRPREPGEI
ncbi:iron ABC transporter permease [Mangrovactinospora gilvigrisea]|uniref:Iron ABC transporter permease n=1 Tax=Mangrovactinospora gilvigrisea TaxID=1428644 RepID=A0A1J7C1N5_9ACTN|nr:iron ABC transporter permease [Mangrovactinospora gilvigrisea]OIV35492.1 iron ABC transporter permease [Mangrovactinospora gilvigrisea]